LALQIWDIRVCTLSEEVSDEVVGLLVEYKKRQHYQSTTLIIFAVYIDGRFLQEALHAAMVVLKHSDVDRRHLPGVR
jgi:hypothetical protein